MTAARHNAIKNAIRPIRLADHGGDADKYRAAIFSAARGAVVDATDDEVVNAGRDLAGELSDEGNFALAAAQAYGTVIAYRQQLPPGVSFQTHLTDGLMAGDPEAQNCLAALQVINAAEHVVQR